jgi:hypothetical protein
MDVDKDNTKIYEEWLEKELQSMNVNIEILKQVKRKTTFLTILPTLGVALG